jgi:hypothetical protein
MAMDASLYLENAWCMKVTGTPSMMQKISWRCDDYHANTIILNQAMGYVLSEKTECVATLVTGYCTSKPFINLHNHPPLCTLTLAFRVMHGK